MSSLPRPVTVGAVDSAAKFTAKVELHLSCLGLKNLDFLSKSDPFIVIYIKPAPSTTGMQVGALPWEELKRTDTIWDNLNPEFPDQIILQYHFEQVQELRFDVYDRDNESEDLQAHDFIGRVETTLSRIMGSRGSTFSAQICLPGQTKSRGKLIVKGEEMSSCKDLLFIQFAAEDLDRKNWFGLGRSDPFFTISRSREDGNFAKVWSSETVKSSLNPTWKQVKIPLQRVCNGDLDRPIRIDVLDWENNGAHKLIGQVQTSVRFLTAGKSLELVNPKVREKKGSKYRNSGSLKIVQSVVEKRHSFLEYIRGGCQLNLLVAIDFTASNGAPSLPSSLHYVNRGVNFDGSVRNINLLNEYQRAILSIGEIVKDYDSDNKFPVYGFGGAVNGATNHCFPLTFDQMHPEVHGVQGIMEAYSNAFNYVSLSGPTLFSRIIAMASQYASAHTSGQGQQEYFVLLILTDGVINDIDQTIEQIVNASRLPLSIIIVGVGEANFDNMEVLDADDVPLSYNGVKMARDIVQFVPFREFKNKHNQALAAATLEELPEQLISYFASKNIKPNAPTLASTRHLAVEASQRNLGESLPTSAQPYTQTRQPPTAPAGSTAL